MAKKPSTLSVIANKLRIAFRTSKDPNFIASKEKIWGWKSQINTLEDGYKTLADCKGNLSTQDVSRVVLNHQGTDEELIDKIIVDDRKSWHGHWSHIEKSMSGIKAICQPNALLSATQSVFEDERVKTFSEEHKELILQEYFYQHIGEGFAESMGRLIDFCERNKDHLAQNTITQLARFMTTDPTFRIYFEARQNDLNDEGRLGKIAPTFLYDLIKSSPEAERKEVIDIFRGTHLFEMALDKEINYVEEHDARNKIDRHFG